MRDDGGTVADGDSPHGLFYVFQSRSESDGGNFPVDLYLADYSGFQITEPQTKYVCRGEKAIRPYRGVWFTRGRFAL